MSIYKTFLQKGLAVMTPINVPILLSLILGGVAICGGSPISKISKVECPAGIDSLALTYDLLPLEYGHQRDTSIQLTLRVRFHNGKLTSWMNDTGDLLRSSLISAYGCGPLFPSGEACSIGFWDDGTNCLFTGISLSAYPSFAVYEFNGGFDYAFVFSEGQGDQESRQIMIYRPGVGALYSRKWKSSKRTFVPVEEFVLKTIGTNGTEFSYAFEKDRPAILNGVAKLEKWMIRLKPKDLDQNMRRVLWEDVVK